MSSVPVVLTRLRASLGFRYGVVLPFVILAPGLFWPGPASPSWSGPGLAAHASSLVVQGASAAGPAVAASAQASPVAGDPLNGKALFLGARRLENGAPSCRACHSVAGVGALGGGALGPDLTGSYAKFGEQGLATILASMPFPTMRPVFARRALTAEEQTHIVAFLRESAAERPAPVVVRVAGLMVGVGVVLLGLTHLLWSGRLRGVRRPMVERRPMARRR
ncbi:MAG: hypothetical protein HY704_00075 [Gemmatimonadetes bacterium]|nr:hypothetical protein [Gemmatimonadota bacterium]